MLVPLQIDDCMEDRGFRAKKWLKSCSSISHLRQNGWRAVFGQRLLWGAVAFSGAVGPTAASGAVPLHPVRPGLGLGRVPAVRPTSIGPGAVPLHPVRPGG